MGVANDESGSTKPSCARSKTCSASSCLHQPVVGGVHIVAVRQAHQVGGRPAGQQGRQERFKHSFP